MDHPNKRARTQSSWDRDRDSWGDYKTSGKGGNSSNNYAKSKGGGGRGSDRDRDDDRGDHRDGWGKGSDRGKYNDRGHGHSDRRDRSRDRDWDRGRDRDNDRDWDRSRDRDYGRDHGGRDGRDGRDRNRSDRNFSDSWGDKKGGKGNDHGFHSDKGHDKGRGKGGKPPLSDVNSVPLGTGKASMMSKMGSPSGKVGSSGATVAKSSGKAAPKMSAKSTPVPKAYVRPGSADNSLPVPKVPAKASMSRLNDNDRGERDGDLTRSTRSGPRPCRCGTVTADEYLLSVQSQETFCSGCWEKHHAQHPDAVALVLGLQAMRDIGVSVPLEITSH